LTYPKGRLRRSKKQKTFVGNGKEKEKEKNTMPLMIEEAKKREEQDLNTRKKGYKHRESGRI